MVSCSFGDGAWYGDTWWWWYGVGYGDGMVDVLVLSGTIKYGECGVMVY